MKNCKQAWPAAPRGLRLGSLAGAALATAVLLGSQLLVAQRYDAESEALLAAKKAAPVAQASTAPALPRL